MNLPLSRADVVEASAVLARMLDALPDDHSPAGMDREAYIRGAIDALAIVGEEPAK